MLSFLRERYNATTTFQKQYYNQLRRSWDVAHSRCMSKLQIENSVPPNSRQWMIRLIKVGHENINKAILWSAEVTVWGIDNTITHKRVPDFTATYFSYATRTYLFAFVKVYNQENGGEGFCHEIKVKSEGETSLQEGC